MKAKNGSVLYVSMFLRLYLQCECYKRILNLTKNLNRVMKMGIKSLLYGAAVVAVSAMVASVTTYKVIEKSNITDVASVKPVEVSVHKAAFAQSATPQERVDLTEAADRSDRKSTRLNSSHQQVSRMPSSA